MTGVFLVHALTAALFYLGSRAMITRALWSRYSAPIASFMDCSACTGFWYGALVAFVLCRLRGVSYLGLDPHDWITIPIVAFASIALNPIAVGLMQRGLDFAGSAVTTEE